MCFAILLAVTNRRDTFAKTCLFSILSATHDTHNKEKVNNARVKIIASFLWFLSDLETSWRLWCRGKQGTYCILRICNDIGLRENCVSLAQNCSPRTKIPLRDSFPSRIKTTRCHKHHHRFPGALQRSQTTYLPLLFWLCGTRCPCPGTRWSTAGLWSRTRCLSSGLRAPCSAPRESSHPGSATTRGRSGLTSAWTKLCSPGWTETGGPPAGDTEDEIYRRTKWDGWEEMKNVWVRKCSSFLVFCMSKWQKLLRQ